KASCTLASRPMIDMHIHVVPPNLPGAGPLGPQLELPVAERAALLRAEMREAGITTALGMGALDAGDADPLGIAGTLEMARHVERLFAIGVMDPRRSDAGHLRAVAEELKTGRVKALKGYLGYLPFGPDHAGYRGYYELAERHRIPVI